MPRAGIANRTSSVFFVNCMFEYFAAPGCQIHYHEHAETRVPIEVEKYPNWFKQMLKGAVMALDKKDYNKNINSNI